MAKLLSLMQSKFLLHEARSIPSQLLLCRYLPLHLTYGDNVCLHTGGFPAPGLLSDGPLSCPGLPLSSWSSALDFMPLPSEPAHRCSGALTCSTSILLSSRLGVTLPCPCGIKRWHGSVWSPQLQAQIKGHAFLFTVTPSAFPPVSTHDTFPTNICVSEMGR